MLVWVGGRRSELPTVTGDGRFRSRGRIASGTPTAAVSVRTRAVGRLQRPGKSCPDKHDCVGSTLPENAIVISPETRSNTDRGSLTPSYDIGSGLDNERRVRGRRHSVPESRSRLKQTQTYGMVRGVAKGFHMGSSFHHTSTHFENLTTV